ncbi:dipeptidase [Paenarthrobacter sp. NPDC058040]|uniref:dipeptidase n=1 Tax=unclassified Paenarthrobacter TaxID=2634190 RepID=UPI0036DE9F4F
MKQLIIDGCNPSNWDRAVAYDSLIAGGVGAVNATVAVWETFEESVDEVGKWIRRFKSDPRLLQIKSASDIDRARSENKLGIILGWQNISPIENDFERLEVFQHLGIRVVQLAYNLRNLVANGCYERHDEGLSTFGVKTVKKLNDLGMLIDLSHVGDQSCRQTIELSEAPVAITHANLREFADQPRNKPAAIVKELAARGGVIGANAFPRFLPAGFNSTIDDFLDAIDSLVQTIGPDHVGIASDFCEGQDMEYWRYLRRLHGKIPGEEPRVPRADPACKGLDTAADMPRITEGLSTRGYSDTDIDKVMGGNWLRLYREVWGS